MYFEPLSKHARSVPRAHRERRGRKTRRRSQGRRGQLRSTYALSVRTLARVREGGPAGRANLDGTGVDQSFITGATGPRGVAVDAG